MKAREKHGKVIARNNFSLLNLSKIALEMPLQFLYLNTYTFESICCKHLHCQATTSNVNLNAMAKTIQELLRRQNSSSSFFKIRN